MEPIGLTIDDGQEAETETQAQVHRASQFTFKGDFVPRKRSIDPFILQAALVGLEAQRQRNEEQIAQVRALLGGRSRRTPRLAAAPAGKKRGMSAAGRKRIAAAQQKRWAEWRKKQAAAQ